MGQHHFLLAKANRLVVPALVAVALLGGCRREASQTPFVLAGHLVVFNYRMAQASFVVTLSRVGPVEAGTAAVARFDNPAGGPAIVIRRTASPLLDKLVLESPPLACVRKDRPYKVVITIADADGVPVQDIVATLTSSLDQTVLPDKPLTTGPGYAPNPEMPAGTATPCPD